MTSPLTPLRGGTTGSPRSPKPPTCQKWLKKCINCISARSTPPHTNGMESGPGNTFRARNRKHQKIHDFRPKKRGSHFFDIFDPHPPAPPPPPTPPKSLKGSRKWVSSGGGLGGSGPKTHWGMPLLDKIMILQGVKLTIQPLGVGYANRPLKRPWGGMWRFPLYRPAWL